MLLKFLGFDAKTMSIRTELMAGLTTFLTMAYILAVNPTILGTTGMNQGAVFTATILSSALATLVMAVYGKLPFALAPGMGLNAFFAFTICATMGYSWQFGLTAVFLEGLIFVVLTFTGLRQKIVDAVPQIVRSAIGPGIGLFIAFVGMQSAGIVKNHETTLVTLGDLHSPGVLLALLGVIISAILLIQGVMGALLIGIFIVTLIGIPLDITEFKGIISTPPSLAPTLMQFEWTHVFTLDMAVCIFTLLFIDMFDTMGTLLGVGQRGGLVDEKGEVKGLKQAFMADAVGTTVGAMLGTSTIATYVESASGVSVGGRSGLTSLTVAVLFILSLFFAPLFAFIPKEATAPVLILVGVMMMQDIGKLNMNEFINAVPVFITMAFMPLTYSISEGILMGMIAFVTLHLFTGRRKDLNIGLLILTLLFILKYAFL